MATGHVESWRCWCGESALERFSDQYDRCPHCRTLVARVSAAPTSVQDERSDLYGLNYFVEHARELGHPDLFARSRLDLSERCAFWLRSLLRRRPPPARVLELGCANGAFVGLLATAGYDATGLDLSPALTTWVARTFGVPVLTGPLEAQRLPAGGVDIVVMMDVLEHLPDPLATLAEVGRVLAPGGLLLVQTPDYPAGTSHQELVTRNDPFLQQLKPQEHLFLLSQEAARSMLERSGFVHLEFEPAIFAEYDQFFVASRQPLPRRADGHEALGRSLGGRIVEALLDACDRAARLEATGLEQQRRIADLERERVDRLETIQRQQRQIHEIESDRAARLDSITRMEKTIDEIERDRTARLDFIHQQQRRIDELEQDRAARLDTITRLEQTIDEIERDRAARLDFIHQQQRRIDELEQAGAARLDTISHLGQTIDEIERDRAARLDFIHQQQRRIDELELDRAAHLDTITRLKQAVAEADLVQRSLEEHAARLGDVEAEHRELLRRLGPLRHVLLRKAARSRP